VQQGQCGSVAVLARTGGFAVAGTGSLFQTLVEQFDDYLAGEIERLKH